MKIYVIRHGTTNWNEKRIIQGRSQNRLSKNGIIGVELSAETLKNEKIDVIFSSPLMRTMQTANILNKYHNISIIKDDRLIELDQGIFTKRRKDTLTEDEKRLKFNRDKNCGIESYKECYNRVKNFVEFLKNKCEYENILIVTHGAVASALENIFDNIKITNFNDYTIFRKFDNAQIKKFELKK